MNKTKVKVEGTGFIGLLQLIFITLKLIGKIEWSWLWVLSPLWLPTAVGMSIILILIIIKLIVETL